MLDYIVPFVFTAACLCGVRIMPCIVRAVIRLDEGETVRPISTRPCRDCRCLVFPNQLVNGFCDHCRGNRQLLRPASRRGFTLVELLVVCALIITLTGFTCAVSGAVRRSSVSKLQKASAPLEKLDLWQ